VLVAIVSDTHLPRGTRTLPEACVRRLRSADLILHAGDLVAVSALDEIEALGPPVHGVHGNVDVPEVRARLPWRQVVDVGGVRIGMIHDGGQAGGRLQRLRASFPGTDAVIYGHSHVPWHERAADGFQIFNPGSPTDRRRQPAHTMGMARVEDGAISFELIDLDRDDTAGAR
jgi:putative phosphoesterase